MKRIIPMAVIAAVILSVPVLSQAQAKVAVLIGYEKAEYVTGEVVISADGSMVMVQDLKSTYAKPLELYLALGFDRARIKVGNIGAGTTGDMSFDAPSGDVERMDSVLVMVPGWSTPVAVGLLK